MFISEKSIVVRREKSVISDKRVKRTNELIEQIRLIKMYGWEKHFKDSIKALRLEEVKKLIKFRIFGILGEAIASTSPQTSVALMCILYTVFGGTISPEKIYTSLIILSFMSTWAVRPFNYAITSYASIRVLRKRVEEILNIEEVISLEKIMKDEEKTNQNMIQYCLCKILQQSLVITQRIGKKVIVHVSKT